MKRAIGIHLGLNYCCVGVFKNGKVDIIQNELWITTIPAIVSFTNNQLLIGQAAK